MLILLALFFVTLTLMRLSQIYYPPGTKVLRRGGSPLRSSDFFMWVTIIVITCFYFLRTSYNDTYAYITSFRNAQSLPELIQSGQLWELAGNPLFYFYQSLARSITSNYHLYFLPPSLLIAWSCIRFIKRYSNEPIMSVIIFFSLGSVVSLMTAMKQGIAIALLLVSIPYAINRQYVRFYLLVFLASLFHTYAVIFVLAPLLFGKPWNLRTFIMLGVSLFSLVTFETTLGTFIKYAQSVGAHAVEEDVFNETSIHLLRVAVYLIPAIMSLVFRKRLFSDSTREENFFVNMSMLSGFILIIGLANGANMIARTAAFYELGIVIALPWMIQKIFQKRSARFVSLVVAALFLLYFFYEFGVAKSFDKNYAAITFVQFLLELIG